MLVHLQQNTSCDYLDDLSALPITNCAIPNVMQALIDDSTFCGLALDEDNQDDLSADRIKNWVAQISSEMEG